MIFETIAKTIDAAAAKKRREKKRLRKYLSKGYLFPFPNERI